MSEEKERLVYTIEEAGQLLHISRGLCYDLVKRGEIPSLKLGIKRRVVPKAALDKMLKGAANE